MPSRKSKKTASTAIATLRERVRQATDPLIHIGADRGDCLSAGHHVQTELLRVIDDGGVEAAKNYIRANERIFTIAFGCEKPEELLSLLGSSQ